MVIPLVTPLRDASVVKKAVEISLGIEQKQVERGAIAEATSLATARKLLQLGVSVVNVLHVS